MGEQQPSFRLSKWNIGFGTMENNHNHNNTDGAWIIIIITPLLVLGFEAIHKHYKNVARQLSLADYNKPKPIQANHVILMWVASIKAR